MTDDRARAVEAQNTPVRAAAMLLLELIGGGCVEDAEDAVRAIVALAAARSQPETETSAPPKNEAREGPWYAGAIGRIPEDDALVWRDDAVSGPQFYAATPKQAEEAATMLNGLEAALAAANAKLAEAEKMRAEDYEEGKRLRLEALKRAEDAEAQAGRMREALLRYGCHRAYCAVRRSPFNPCDCGFNRDVDAALSAAPTHEPRPLPAGEGGGRGN